MIMAAVSLDLVPFCAEAKGFQIKKWSIYERRRAREGHEIFPKYL
jgi:hypothetical protein